MLQGWFGVLNSLNFCLSIKFLISPSILNEVFARYSNHSCRLFSFSTLNISCHSLLAYRVSVGRPAVNHMGFPLYVTSCFSLDDFNILYLCLISVSLINVCLDMFILEFSTIISSKIFSMLFFLLLALGPL